MEHKVLGARVLEKAIQLLFSFETNIPEQSLFELSRKLRFPPSTTHRLLKVMMSHRLIQQDHMTKLYRLGPSIAYLASWQGRFEHPQIALPIMEHLRDVTGENTALHELPMAKGFASTSLDSHGVTPFRSAALKAREKLFNLVKEAAQAISQKMSAPVIKSKSNSVREPREIYNGSDKRIEKKRMFV